MPLVLLIHKWATSHSHLDILSSFSPHYSSQMWAQTISSCELLRLCWDQPATPHLICEFNFFSFHEARKQQTFSSSHEQLFGEGSSSFNGWNGEIRLKSGLKTWEHASCCFSFRFWYMLYWGIIDAGIILGGVYILKWLIWLCWLSLVHYIPFKLNHSWHSLWKLICKWNVLYTKDFHNEYESNGNLGYRLVPNVELNLEMWA